MGLFQRVKPQKDSSVAGEISSESTVSRAALQLRDEVVASNDAHHKDGNADRVQLREVGGAGLQWIFTGVVAEQLAHLGETNVNILRWQNRCSGITAFWSFLLLWSFGMMAVWNICTGHMLAGTLGFLHTGLQLAAFFLIRYGASRGILSPDTALTCLGLCNTLGSLFAPIITHIVHGGGYHTGNIIFGSISGGTSAMFHLRVSRPIELGIFVVALRTVLVVGLFWFDDLLQPLDGLPSGIHHLGVLFFVHSLLSMSFILSLWKAMKRMTEMYHSTTMIVGARENKREANNVLINSLCPPSKSYRLTANLASSNAMCHQAEEHTDCTVLQMDIKGFTALSSLISATELVDLINAIFTSIDEAANIVGCVWKVETVGDCYKAIVGGIFPCEDHSRRAVCLGLAIIEIVQGVSRRTGMNLTVRCGVATGSVTGAIMGTRLPRYLLHGPTMELVGLLEQTAQAGTVQCTEEAAASMREWCAMQEREVELPRGEGALVSRSIRLSEAAREGMAAGLDRGKDLERLMAMFRPWGAAESGEEDAAEGGGVEDVSGSEAESGSPMGIHPLVPPAMRRASIVEQRQACSQALRSTLDVMEQEFVSIAPPEVVATPRGTRRRRRSLFFSSNFSASFKSTRSYSSAEGGRAHGGNMGRTTSRGSDGSDATGARSQWSQQDDELQRTLSGTFSVGSAEEGMLKRTSTTPTGSTLPPPSHGAPPLAPRRGSSEKLLRGLGGALGGSGRWTLGPSPRAVAPVARVASSGVLLGGSSDGASPPSSSSWLMPRLGLASGEGGGAAPLPMTPSGGGGGMLRAVGPVRRGSSERSMGSEGSGGEEGWLQADGVRGSGSPLVGKKVLADPPTPAEVGQLGEAEQASAWTARRYSVMSVPVSERLETFLEEGEEESMSAAGASAAASTTPLDALEGFPDPTPEDRQRWAFMRWVGIGEGSELALQVGIFRVFLASGALGAAAHCGVLLCAAERPGTVDPVRWGPVMLRAAAIMPGLMAALLLWLLWGGAHAEAVMAVGVRRTRARAMIFGALSVLPLACIGGPGRGPLMHSAGQWGLLPLQLLVRCFKAPTWTAPVAWGTYLAFVAWTHLSAASLEHVNFVASRDTKLGLWSGGESWWVAVLYVVNLLIPTTAAMQPYLVTAWMLQRAVGHVEAEHEALEFQSALQQKLLSVLVPRPIAERLQQGEERVADQIEEATVLFVYIRDVDDLVAQCGARRVMEWLNQAFENLDSCVSAWACQSNTAVDGHRCSLPTEDASGLGGTTGENSVLKVETFNNFYLAVSGAAYNPESGKPPPMHVDEAVRVALEMARKACRVPRPDGKLTSLKLGLNSGPVCAGVISTSAPRFSIFGDTVNVASRMASNSELCESDRVFVHMSGATAGRMSEEFKDFLVYCNYDLVQGAKPMQIKGKGEMITWSISQHVGKIRDHPVDGDVKEI